MTKKRWHLLNSTGIGIGETRDCSVISIAILCEVEYKIAHSALLQTGRAFGRAPFMPTIEAAFDLLGFEKIEWSPAKMRTVISTYPGCHCELKNITTKHPDRFASAWAAEHRLLILTRRHACALMNGKIDDWASSCSKRVEEIWQIVKKD